MYSSSDALAELTCVIIKQTSQNAEPLLPHLKPSNPLWHPAPLTSSSTVLGGTHPTAVEGLHVSDSPLSDVARPAPLELPPRIEMVLADVDTGSNTPSLVGKVMEWRKKKPEWGELSSCVPMKSACTDAAAPSQPPSSTRC